MKKIELFLNVLHFCFYKWHYKLHLLANKINPVNLIHKLPFQKRKYEELDINIHKEIDKAFGDKASGISVMVSGGTLLAVEFFFFLTITIILNGLMGQYIGLPVILFVVCGILSATTTYFYVFRKDKYLLYFNRFEKWPKSDKRKYNCISLGFILVVFCLFLYSFRYLYS
jgi:hypothetical protein